MNFLSGENLTLDLRKGHFTTGMSSSSHLKSTCLDLRLNQDHEVPAGSCLCWGGCRIQVQLRKHNLALTESSQQFISSAKVIHHLGYSAYTLDNDIVLIKLATPAQLNKSVQTISLPTSGVAAGTTCLISGWGNTLSNGNSYPDLLQCLKAPVLSDSECQDAYPGQITKNMMCVCDSWREEKTPASEYTTNCRVASFPTGNLYQ
ncbi:trypsin-like [Pithys albifrons albifrons]|uniref:trypsin-like n=1 Tax=Pithys albifrons albifrons TaxID=3385563 RepID=UPI003A5D142C